MEGNRVEVGTAADGGVDQSGKDVLAIVKKLI